MANTKNNESTESTDVIEIKEEPDIVEVKEDTTGSDDDICELEHLRKLFIGGLALHTTEESLKAFYSRWGNVVDVVVMRDSATKRSRGFGFITYTKSSSVNAAQDNRPHVIDGKTVEAKRALPRPERESRETNISVKKLFVGGLKDNHDEECLKEYFSQFGNVVSIKILTDRVTGKRRGFAFVEFDDYDAVDKAILQKSHSIKYVNVDVKKSVYKQEKQNQQQAQESNGGIDNSKNQNRPNMKPHAGPVPPPHMGYQMPPPQNGMPPHHHHHPPPPMNGCPPPGPPPNYWAPPPPMQGYGNNYQHPPAPAPMNNWNNAWNAAPPPPAGNWQQNHWNYGPPPAPNNWNAQVPPPGTPASVPVPQPMQPPVQAPIPPPAPNFGTGYQQNYGGGPVKHNGTNTNRMNPYTAPPTNYGNGQAAPTPAYGYVAPPSQPPKNMPAAVPVPPVGAKYRR